MAETQSNGGLKVLILVGLLAVLGYLAIQENGSIPQPSETTISTQQLKQSSQKPHQTPTVSKSQGERIDLGLIWLSDLEMEPLATRSLTGDVRPFYLVSGRIENSTGKALRSVTIRISVQSTGSPDSASREYNKDWQNYDEADVQVNGPIPDGMRGFSQQIQVLPPRGKRWTFEADVIAASVEPNGD
jgi:hypothetical protein